MSSLIRWKNVLLTLSAMSILQASAMAQAAPQYTMEEYALYEEAVKQGTPEAIIDFINGHADSALVQYSVKAYIQLMQKMQQEGNFVGAMEAGEKLLALHPEDLNALFNTAGAAYQAGHYDRAVPPFEKVYAAQPSANFAFYLFNSYNQLGDVAKQIDYGEKVVAHASAEEGTDSNAVPNQYQVVDVMATLTSLYASEGQWAKASEYAGKVIAKLANLSKPEQTGEEQWKAYLQTKRSISHNIMGREDSEAEKWAASVTHYEDSLKFSSEPALRAENYYYIGMAQWRQKEADSAMEAFARGSMQTDAPHAKLCRDYLEKLYRSTHNGSLAGLEDFIKRIQ